MTWRIFLAVSGTHQRVPGVRVVIVGTVTGPYRDDSEHQVCDLSARSLTDSDPSSVLPARPDMSGLI
jgi:hypothetical protein